MSGTYKIKALSSGAGWWKAYMEGDAVHFWPVLAFAVIADPETPEHDIILGQTSSIAMDGAEYEELQGFAGYYHETEFEVVGEKLKRAAEDRLHTGGY